ncbi:MAG: hypothetical protein AAF962_23155 [Actinomycetota bacterium]
MTTHLTLFLAVAEAPGTSMADRLGSSLVALGQALLLTAAVLVGFVILFSLMPRWAGAIFGLLLIASFFTAPDVWMDWFMYVATGSGEASGPTSSTTTTLGGGG